MNFSIGEGLRHPRERLAQPAISILDTTRGMNFQCGFFSITTQKFETRSDFITFDYQKRDIFCKFVKNDTDLVVNKGFIHGDTRVFSQLLEKCFIGGVCQIQKEYLKRIVLISHLSF